jgi:hypothetical protein
VLARELGVWFEIAAQGLRALVVLQQVEGGEQRQVETLVEDQGGLDPAVVQEQAAPQLGQVVAMLHRDALSLAVAALARPTPASTSRTGARERKPVTMSR